MQRRLSVREGAEMLGVSPSSFLRLVKQRYSNDSAAAVGGVA